MVYYGHTTEDTYCRFDCIYPAFLEVDSEKCVAASFLHVVVEVLDDVEIRRAVGLRADENLRERLLLEEDHRSLGEGLRLTGPERAPHDERRRVAGALLDHVVDDPHLILVQDRGSETHHVALAVLRREDLGEIWEDGVRGR